MFIYRRSSADSLGIDCWQEEEVQQNVVCLWGGVLNIYMLMSMCHISFLPSFREGKTMGIRYDEWR